MDFRYHFRENLENSYHSADPGVSEVGRDRFPWRLRPRIVHVSSLYAVNAKWTGLCA